MKKYKTLLSMGLILSLSMLNTIPSFAAGRSIEAFKANRYSGRSDGEEMIEGIKSKASGYSFSFKKNGISASDFYGKSKAIKYWASHGSNSGTVWGDNASSITISNGFKWSGSNLEFVFLAACNQLDGANTNPRAKYANSMIGSNAVRVICGYHEAAPGADPNKDARVVRNFISKAKTGESVKSSWIQANQMYGNRNYCVLTHSGNVQYSRFEGFPGATYARPSSSSKTILRFSAAKPNGATQPYAVKKVDLKTIASLSVPNYSIRAIKKDISIKDGVKTVVQKLDGFVTTLNGEIGDQSLKTSSSKALQLSRDWLNSVYNGVTTEDYKNSNVSVLPIVKAEVDLSGNVDNEKEEIIAYDVTITSKFNGIPIVGDKYCAIIDDTGVISSSVNHHDYEIVPNAPMAKSISKVKDTLIRTGITDKNIRDISNVEFRDDDGDGFFDPSCTISLQNGQNDSINLITHTVSEI